MNMWSVGNNVVSILGYAITEVPEYADKCRAKITFTPAVMAGHRKQPVIGTKTVFGLVLHRHLRNGYQGICRWIISDPGTGRAIAWGRTRKDALEDLALRVAFHGGEDEFDRRLQNARDWYLSESTSTGIEE